MEDNVIKNEGPVFETKDVIVEIFESKLCKSVAANLYCAHCPATLYDTPWYEYIDEEHKQKLIESLKERCFEAVTNFCPNCGHKLK